MTSSSQPMDINELKNADFDEEFVENQIQFVESWLKNQLSATRNIFHILILNMLLGFNEAQLD